ncbi:MAG: UDP-N-acetylmuramoyl-tripeptide--D-alanyl-D-alanine ligase [Actinomycetota bacterium]
MIPLSLAQVADVVGGALLSDDPRGPTVRHVTIDSREAGPGSLFVPLEGSQADGHDFVADALARGAAGYLCAEARCARGPLADAPSGAVVVDDPADALLGLGAWLREEVDPVVVTLTGSQGKTTTKDLIAAAVGPARRVVANRGSYNNELGVPLTCTELEADSEVLVSEIGARGVGHIAPLAALLRADVAIVTAVSAAHLELLGDLETVARAKAELVEALEPDAVAILNADDPRVAAMAGRTRARVVTYGLEAEADWRARDIVIDGQARPRFRAEGPHGHTEIALPLPGRHNVGNALAALAAAQACGVDPAAAAAGLADARVSRWRMELARRDDGTSVLNDAYNANPASTAAALEALVALDARRRWAVLGLMAELGAGSEEAHREVGRACAAHGLDGVLVVGEAAPIAEGARQAGFGGVLEEVADAEEAGARLAALLGPGDAVLVKASRSVGLEGLAADLLEPRR